MRILQSSLLRSVCAIAVGYMLVIYRHDMVHWMTLIFGALFFISGLISVIAYYVEKRRVQSAAEQWNMMMEMRSDSDTTAVVDRERAEQLKALVKPSYPIVGIGSMILGIILAVMPDNFVKGLLYTLSAILILGAINQLVNLITARKFSSIGIVYWLFPIVILLVGIYTVVRPMEMAALPFKLLGWGLVLYGIVECINALKIYRVRKQYLKMQQQLEEQAAAANNAQEVEAEEVKE